MGTTWTPTDEHEQFDAMCSELDEFDHLPSWQPGVTEPGAEDADEPASERPINELILAGLVSPH